MQNSDVIYRQKYWLKWFRLALEEQYRSVRFHNDTEEEVKDKLEEQQDGNDYEHMYIYRWKRFPELKTKQPSTFGEESFRYYVRRTLNIFRNV